MVMSTWSSLTSTHDPAPDNLVAQGIGVIEERVSSPLDIVALWQTSQHVGLVEEWRGLEQVCIVDVEGVQEPHEGYCQGHHDEAQRQAHSAATCTINATSAMAPQQQRLQDS